MKDTTIFDSSGKIRYPATTGLPDSEREKKRDMFFNSVYVWSDQNEVHLNFYASTGTPEQFIGNVETKGKSNKIRSAQKELARVVEEELGWSLANPDASEGHRLFTSIGNITSEGVARYSIGTLVAATKGTHTIDLGTPSIDRATSVLHWLVENGPGSWSIAVTGDGRTPVVEDADIVIVPGVTEDQVVGINGSDEQIQRRYYHKKASEATQALTGGGNYDHRTVLANLKWWVDSRNDYVAEREKNKNHRRDKNLMLGVPILSVAGFIIAFALGGGTGHIIQWWTKSIIAGNQVELYSVTQIASLLNRGGPEFQPQNIFGLGIVLILVWIGVITALRLSADNIKRDSDNQESLSRGPTQEFTDKINSIMSGFEKVKWADNDVLLNEIASRSEDLPNKVVFYERSTERRDRILEVAVISLGVGVALGIIGYGTGRYLLSILQFWLTLVEVIIITSVISLIGISVVAIYDKLFSGRPL